MQRQRTAPRSGEPATRENAPKIVNLALQGGGAHGAFTWGVLDRLLEDGRIGIEAISGTSAGAMNAVVVADGLMRNGNDGAREALQGFWTGVSRAAWFSPIRRTPLDMILGRWSMEYSPGYLITDAITRALSPYQFNPCNLNPLRDFLETHINFDRVRQCDRLKLFVSATRVRDGRAKVFGNEELSADAVMASTCLPYLFQAVEIDGESYWDGGYMGNPVLFVFNHRTASRDVVLVQINPLDCQSTPKSAHAIQNRINEITFNSSLLKDLRAISFVTKLIDEGLLDDPRYRKLLIHRIEAQNELRPLEASSKLNAQWAFLTHLRDIGRRAADRWLDQNFDSLGREGTVDIRAEFL
jgi:NTE family protein